MPKGVKNGPQHQRLISRIEAAEMIGCSIQTISNWVKKGIIKGHKIDNMLLVDKESIEILFDTAADVAEMEKNLKELKEKLNDEIQKWNQKVMNLRQDNLISNQEKFLKELIDSIIDNCKDQLSEVELIIVSGILQGRPTQDIANEIGYTTQYVRHSLRRLTPMLLEITKYAKVRKEKQDLAKENKKLKDEIRRLNSIKYVRDLKLTPFAKDITEFGFQPRICNLLLESGCNTLEDLLQFDERGLLKIPKLGVGSVTVIKERLDQMGLSLGMDLQNMSDKEFNALVKKVSVSMPLVFPERLPARYKVYGKDVARMIETKVNAIKKGKDKLELQKGISEYWRIRYTIMVDQNKKLKDKIEKYKQNCKVITYSDNSASKKKKAEEESQQLVITTNQLNKALEKLNKASEREEALLRKISSLENLVEFYKKERFSSNNEPTGNDPL